MRGESFGIAWNMSLPSSYAPEDASESRTREECHIVIHPYEARDKRGLKHATARRRP